MERTLLGYSWKTRRIVFAISFAVFLATAVNIFARPAVAATRPEATEVTELHFLSDVCGVPIAADGVIHTSSRALDDDRILQHIRVDLLRRSSTSQLPAKASCSKTSAGSSGDLGSGQIVDLAGMWMVLQGRFDRVCTYFAT